MLTERCHNDNHGRTIVTVRFCASCGTIVNGRVLARRCVEELHSRMRRAQNNYCVHCGDRLLRRG